MKIILTVDLLSIFQNFSKYSFIFGCFSKPKKVISLTSKCGEKVRIYHRQSSNSCSESCFHKIHTYQPILSHFGLFWSIFGLFLPILSFFWKNVYCIALNYAFICLMKLFRSVISIVFISFAAKSRKTSIFADLANFRPVFAYFGPYFVYFELLWKDRCIALHYAFICHTKWSGSLISNIFINHAVKN